LSVKEKGAQQVQDKGDWGLVASEDMNFS